MMGKNSATYKFALAASLIELSAGGADFISLEELAVPFSRHLREHLKHSGKQSTRNDIPSLIEACNQSNNGEIDDQSLIENTVKLGFSNVIDAFHVIGRKGDTNEGNTPLKFFHDDRKSRGGITLTDDFFYLAEGNQFASLPHEVQARWNLVETAWELGIASNVIDIEYDLDGGLLYIPRKDTARTDVTSCKDALNGYQKGRCFYCFIDISVESGSDSLAQVDHFLPHILKRGRQITNLDGVWNLVLACRNCNSRKSATPPKVEFLTRLNTRNNYLISSRHPLRETLINQTGDTRARRHSFLYRSYQSAVATRISRWGPPEEFGTTFSVNPET